METNGTDRVLTDDQISQVHLTFYGPGGGIPYEFHANDDPYTVVNAIRAAGFNAMRQTKIVSHGWKSSGTKFCPQFVEGNCLTGLIDAN